MLPNAAMVLGGFFAHARTSGNVIRGVAHQPKHVDYLCRRLNIKFCFYLFNAHYFELFVTIFGAIHKYILCH